MSDSFAIQIPGVGELESYDDHVQAWHFLDGYQDDVNWLRGLLADSVEKEYGEARLETFAKDVGRSYGAVALYRQVFQEFENSTRIEFSGLKWEHYRLALSAPGDERFQLLKEAATTSAPKSEKLPWPTRELKQVIKERWPAPRPPLPPGKFSLLYADPPWLYEGSVTDTRKIENQYPTLSQEELVGFEDISGRPLTDLATDDAVLFMWATSPKLDVALKVMDAWGFSYRTCAVWVKRGEDSEQIGMGYYFRQQHELLLIGKRGDMPPPPETKRVSSVIEAPREAHSAKPDSVYELLENLYSDETKVELFARSERPGWTSYGNELP